MRVIIALLVVSALFAAADTDIEEEIQDQAPTLRDENPELSYNLESAIAHLHRLVPEDMKRHTTLLKHHAASISMLQGKALPGKKYNHNFAKSRAAIKAALAALTSDLSTGHAHDQRALNNSYNAVKRRIRDTRVRNRGRVTTFRHKACPTKRAEEKANQQKRAAKAAVDAIRNTRVCDVSTTWRSMGVRSNTPKLGSAMYNKWAKMRAQFVKKTAQHNAAIRAHNASRRKHDKAMTSFKVALDLEAKNTYRSCRDNHKDYNRLKRDVAANVRTRKEVFIATLVVGCYADNLVAGGNARSCANRKRGTSTSRWNINPKALAACASRGRLAQILGPKGWQPTYRNCSQHRRIQKEIGQKASEKRNKKEKRTKTEKANKAKEKRSKQNRYRGGGHGVNYGGAFYRTLAGANINSRSIGCESGWRAMPAGCSIAPNSMCAHFGSRYPWSTHVIVCQSQSYGTQTYQTGRRWSSSKYWSRSGNNYKVNGCSLRLLLRCG